MGKSSLKFMREDKGMTQAELAEKSGVSLRLIQAYEQGYKDIHKGNVVTVLRIAEALDCDVYEIL
jgi:transcriptional regulator with XRE-family HTH domain